MTENQETNWQATANPHVSAVFRPLFQRDKPIFQVVENLNRINRVNFPNRSTRKGVRSYGPSARTGRVAAIEEKLSGDSYPLSSDRKRVGHMWRRAGVGVESIPQRGPE